MRRHLRHWLVLLLTVGLSTFWLVATASGARADTPTLSIGDTKVVESPTGSVLGYLTVTLSAPQPNPVSFDWTTADGTATAGTDYKAASGTDTIAAGQINTKIELKIFSDVGKDGSSGTNKEVFHVNISNPVGATIIKSSGKVQVLEFPTVSIGDSSIVEPLVQSATAKSKIFFTVTLSEKLGYGVTVFYTTTDGTAKAGEDYKAVSGSVTMAAGVVSTKISVLIKADSGTTDVPGEGNETFHVVLTSVSPSKVFITRGSGLGTILEQDPPGPPQNVTANAGPGVGQVSLSWSAPPSDGGVAISSYSYEVSTNGGATYGPPINVGMATSAIDPCGSPSITCTYQVFATNGIGTGPAGGPAAATTFDAPGAPQNLTATPDVPTSGNIDLAWSAPLTDGGTPVTEYDYAVSTDGGLTFGPLVNVGTNTSATDPCGTGNTCTYEVFATNIVGQGPASGTATNTGP